MDGTADVLMYPDRTTYLYTRCGMLPGIRREFRDLLCLGALKFDKIET